MKSRTEIHNVVLFWYFACISHHVMLYSKSLQSAFLRALQQTTPSVRDLPDVKQNFNGYHFITVCLYLLLPENAGNITFSGFFIFVTVRPYSCNLGHFSDIKKRRYPPLLKNIYNLLHFIRFCIRQHMRV